MTKQAGGRLQYKLKPTRRKYSKDLVKMCKQHKMEEKSHVMMRAKNFTSETEHNDARESFDKQHTELQIACNKKCRKFRIGRSEYTPLLASTDRRQKVYKWIQDYKARPERTPDTRNLERACRNNDIECPHKMGVQQAAQGQRECTREMEAIRSQAPYLREEYSAKSYRMAPSRKKTVKARSIERIIAKERDRGQYRRMRCGVGKPRANPVTQVITTDDDGTQTTHEGKEAVQNACMKSIGKEVQSRK